MAAEVSAPLDVDEDYALVTVIERSALTGDLTGTRLLLGLLSLFLAGVGLACAQFLARDVGTTAARLRSEAERIASGDLQAASAQASNNSASSRSSPRKASR